MEQELSTIQMINALRISAPTFRNYTMEEFMKFCSVGEFDIIKKTRKSEICFNRQIACVFGISEGLTQQAVGEALNIDHATVIHSVKKIYEADLYSSKLDKYLTMFADNIYGIYKGFTNTLSCSQINLEINFHKQNKQLCIN